MNDYSARRSRSLVAEIETARFRIDQSDMDPCAKLIAHGWINAHIMLAREFASLLGPRADRR